MYIDLPLINDGIESIVTDRALRAMSEDAACSITIEMYRAAHERGVDGVGGSLTMGEERHPRWAATVWRLEGLRYITDGCPVRYEP